jgi:hypothetical protein
MSKPEELSELHLEVQSYLVDLHTKIAEKRRTVLAYDFKVLHQKQRINKKFSNIMDEIARLSDLIKNITY